jgi:MinD superfamily P-loop ATPase
MKRVTLKFDYGKCDFCGSCVAVCRPDAIILLENAMQIDRDSCNACGLCVVICPFRALSMEKA